MSIPVNEITILMAINSVGIIAIMGMFIYISIVGIFGKPQEDSSGSQYSRS